MNYPPSASYAQFEYKSFTIIVSAQKPNPQVIVLSNDPPDKQQKFVFHSTQDAIVFIDAYVYIKDIPWTLRNDVIRQLMLEKVITPEDIL